MADSTMSYIDGDWTQSEGEPSGLSGTQIERTLVAAERAAIAMRALTAERRAALLAAIGDILERRQEEIASTISREVGKPITEARAEAARTPGIFRLAASELTRSVGEVLPLDAMAAGAGRFGFTMRQPCGVVLAITPFNYPLLLVAHKVAPALAAGNAVVLKPATVAARTAAILTEAILEAGTPPDAVQLVVGPGPTVMPFVRDPRIRKISFTGSTDVGEALTREAGVKRLSLELGGNAPVVICPDADLAVAAASIGMGGYVNAGQACISPQRIVVVDSIADDFVEQLVQRVAAIQVGSREHDQTQLAGLVTEAEAVRVESLLAEASRQGATVRTGGGRDGSVVQPSVVDGIQPGMRLFDEELFGPAVGVIRVADLDAALRIANQTPYGLSAAVFTSSIATAFAFAREMDAGNVMVNWNPLWRSDLMPYGGFKASGFGKEGVRYAMDEMSELKTVIFHGLT